MDDELSRWRKGGVLRCTCVTELDELADYRSEWESLRRTCAGPIYSSYSLSALWLDVFSGNFSPNVIMVEDKGDLVGLAPFYIRSHKVAGIPIRKLSLIGQGGDFGFNNVRILMNPERPDVLDGIMTGLDGTDWNILKASHMEDGPLVRQFMSCVQSAWNWQEDPPISAVQCPLPKAGEVVDSFGKKTRSNIKNRMNRLEKEGGFTFRSLGEEDVDRAVDVYAQHHIERWGSKGGSLFNDRENIEFLRRVLKLSISEGFGFGYELVIGDNIAAQSFGFIEDEMARGYMMGMNNDLAKYSPGIVLLVLAMEDLRHKGIKVVDTGAGTEGYKQHLWGRTISLTGLQANRGMVSFLTRLASSPTAQRLDSALGLKRRLFDGIYD